MGDPSTASFFVDTNILVYAFSEQDIAKREIARTLAETNGAWVSTQVLAELANVLTRRFKIPANEVRERVLSISGVCEVVTVTPSIVLDALRVMQRYGYGFFDSQVIATALACGATVLYTEDLHGDQTIDGALTIRSPFRLRTGERRAGYRSRARAGAARS